MLTRLLLLVVALLVALAAGLPPRPPVDEAHVAEYLDDHGAELLSEYARQKLDRMHPGGSGATSSFTVAKESKKLMVQLEEQPLSEQLRRLTVIHDRVSL